MEKIIKQVKGNSIKVIALLLLFISFLITRLYNLMSLPIFTDEAIYTRWAQIANYDSNWRFISLVDGKQPSFIWLDMIMMRLVADPLLAGRLVSVVAGFLALVGMFFLTREVFKDKQGKVQNVIIAIIAVGLLVFYPFSIIYDRLALYESLLAAFFIWGLYFQILFVRTLRLDIAMILGFILGGGALTKSSMFLAVYFSPLLLLLFNFQKNGFKKRLIKFAVLTIVSIVICYGMYSILRLSPNFHMINQKNAIFVHPPYGYLTELTNDQRIEAFISNSRGLVDWFFHYFTVPFFVLAVISFFVFKKFSKEKIILILWFFLPFLSLCIFGKTLYPRYLLFMTMPLLPLVALSIYALYMRFKNNLLRVLVALTIFAIPLHTTYFIIFDFARAPIPKLDLEQLINGWPAGGGVNESIEFFTQEAKKGEIMIGTQGTFGLMPAVYEIYLKDNKNIHLNGFWPVESDKLPDLLLDQAKRMPAYFVFYQPCHGCDYVGDSPDGLDLVKIKSFKKGVGETFLTIYQVKPQQ